MVSDRSAILALTPPYLQDIGTSEAEGELHLFRMRAMLKAHPELRGLIGPQPWTAAWIVLVFASQVLLAWFVSGQAWWAVVPLAYLVGAFVSLSLWTLVHECTHDLVLRGSTGNRWLGILAGLPLVIPAASSFRYFHLLHHRHLGDPILDGDVPSRWEVRLTKNCPFRKALWLSCGALVQALRPLRMIGHRPFDRWMAANVVLQVSFDILVVVALGWSALVFLLLSNIFALGLHPLGARWIQEHFELSRGQQTYSYYGPLNRVLFNAGYHTEHHDLMRVAWSRLPQIRAIAPEFYRDRTAYGSWCALLVTFLLSREVTLDQRRPEAERAT